MMTLPALDIEDPAQAREYLRERGFFRGVEDPAVRVLGGGVSGKAVLVEDRAGGGVVLKQALPKLRVGVDWFSPPDRVHREAAGLRWLRRLEPPGSVPNFLFEDFDRHILAMSAVPSPHANLKEEFMAGRISMKLAAQMGTLLARIHGLSAGRGPELAGGFGDASYFESLRLEPYYLFSARAVPAAEAFLHELAAATRTHREALVHGDFSPKNILVRDGRICLLDHEVIHWGDPAFDPGFALAHFLSKARHFPARREAFAAAAGVFFSAYREETPCGAEREARVVRHALGCLLARVAGRSQLEYLTPAEKARQAAQVTALMPSPPAAVASLIDLFVTLC